MSDIEEDQIEDVIGPDFSAITTEILNRINALLKLQEQSHKIEELKEQEYDEIHKKYKPLFDELIQLRTSIVNGSVEPTDDESAPKEPLTISDLPSKTDIKGIPNFWLGVLKNFPLTKDLLHPEDEPVLAHLIDINVLDDEKDPGFTVNFVFSPNEFFSNTNIAMVVTIENNEVASINVDEIQWKEGKKYIIKQVEKKTKRKGPKGKPPVVTTKIVEEKLQSLFTVLLVDSESPDAEFRHDEENVASPDEILQIQAGILDTLTQKVVPFAIGWFLGRNNLEDDGFDFDDMENFDEEDDEDIPQLAHGKPAAGQPPKPNNPECKQQ